MTIPIATQAAFEHAERMLGEVLRRLGVTREDLMARLDKARNTNLNGRPVEKTRAVISRYSHRFLKGGIHV